MKKWLRNILRSDTPYQTLIQVDISKAALLHNLQAFQKYQPNLQIAPVLKSNAYGHGLTLVGEVLDSLSDTTTNIPFLVIDSYYEAFTLRNSGVSTPLLIIGYTDIGNIQECSLKKVSFTVTSLDMLKLIAAQNTNQVNRPLHLHLKIDTGMCRQGILLHEIPEAFEIFDLHPHLVLEGICSHLGDSENTDTSFTNQQIQTWNNLVDDISKKRTLKYIHISATHGISHTKNIRANVMRLGIGLYGIWSSPIPPVVDLHPALSMYTIVTGKKTIKKGSKIGYSGTFVAQHDITIATLPIGYFEGLDRGLSNKGKVDSFPIVGNISMNMSTIDVSSKKDISIGTRICVINNKSSEENSVESMARISGKIPYEILVHIPQHLHRTLVM